MHFYFKDLDLTFWGFWSPLPTFQASLRYGSPDKSLSDLKAKVDSEKRALEELNQRRLEEEQEEQEYSMPLARI